RIFGRFYLIISIKFFLAAKRAGTHPKIIPIVVETPSDMRIELIVVILYIFGIINAINCEMQTPIIIQMTPPVKQSTILSIKNLNSIALLLAPQARRIAISSVLADTEMYITFITPIPEIKREIAATAVIK